MSIDLARFFPTLASGPAAVQPIPSSVPLVDVSAAQSSLVLAPAQGEGGSNALAGISDSPIAKYPTPRPAQVYGSMILVSPALICYGVKPAMVRVIDANTTAKTLLKGHSQPILDMCFGANETIATIGEDVRPPPPLLLSPCFFFDFIYRTYSL